MNHENNEKEKPKIEESFVKGIASALQKAPVRNAGRIYLTDLWTITSLPEDLIVEILSQNTFELPEGATCVVDDRRRKKRIIYATEPEEKEIEDEENDGKGAD
ncbi:hypothetical protein [Kosmotoga pacifica]|uniref:Uncharacterized protein n=1 Tax=Kosmotoga pacifica TaxID=1330330 RepID=A0A0G2ZCQ6_9BACT|nr:hypothetical protein [Kosmotoga pacifica]AKI97334.1 hypothetical protein IX53_05325 [Kosmotoga pacifica]